MLTNYLTETRKIQEKIASLDDVKKEKIKTIIELLDLVPEIGNYNQSRFVMIAAAASDKELMSLLLQFVFNKGKEEGRKLLLDEIANLRK